MNDSNFAGTGKNPGGPDIPLGLGMRLAQHPAAMEAFGKASKRRKEEIIRDIQASVTGDDALKRINDTVSALNREANYE